MLLRANGVIALLLVISYGVIFFGSSKMYTHMAHDCIPYGVLLKRKARKNPNLILYNNAKT